MINAFLRCVVLAMSICSMAQTTAYFDMEYGQKLPASNDKVTLWWASSGWKIHPDKSVPANAGEAIVIRAARNECEAAQLVVRPSINLKNLRVRVGPLSDSAGDQITAEHIEVLRVRYVNVTQPTDKSSAAGPWPDPLPPLKTPIDLQADKNQPFWIRVKVPPDVPAGMYSGKIALAADGYSADVTLKVEVYDFVLPDRMTCTTAFGFSPSTVFHYQKTSGPEQKRIVLDKYLANFSEHHISPYDPAPLDDIEVTWPAVRPPERKWDGGTEVTNEKHDGQRSLLLYDDRTDLNASAMYKGMIEIPKGGFRLRFWYRTAVPEHQFLVTLNHCDSAGNWMSGRNNDIGLAGNGSWQQFDRLIERFPEGAKSVQLHLRATSWTEDGANIGLVWFDDVSLTDAATGKELIEGGDFEPAQLPQVEEDQLQVKFGFTAWDKAMQRAIDRYHFNSFRLDIAGLGGGTFHARHNPELLGFSEDTPHYKAMFTSYCRQIQDHLQEKGWLEEAYVYWFDEPDPKDYEFVNNGFAKLKQAAPDINRMLTEQVEPQLIGGPNIWCPVTSSYKHEPAEQRRREGEKFWWYVCTGPKAPYCTLFIDHPATEMRVWLWQTWKYNVEGILVWETNYWTSTAAYPDNNNPQNPYADPMGWQSGYSTPKGEKRPWGNGDGRFIYPPEGAADARPSGPMLDGPVDSIRWEMLRDGIEDYEYLAMLKRLLSEKGGKLTDQQRNEFTQLLEVPPGITKDMTTFTKDPLPIEVIRDKIARAITQLSKL
jgi:hypothetical protein